MKLIAKCPPMREAMDAGYRQMPLGDTYDPISGTKFYGLRNRRVRRQMAADARREDRARRRELHREAWRKTK